LYYFIDGQELTAGFLLKVLVLLIIAAGIFTYYLSDTRAKLTPQIRNIYRVVSCVVVLGSIIWGFVVLGSPRTQRLYRYDDQKVNDLMNINNEVINHYSMNGVLPNTLADITVQYYISLNDAQTQKPYEYEKLTATTYNLCAAFNKNTNDKTGSTSTSSYYYGMSWLHDEGRYCFKQTINPNIYAKPVR